MTTPQSEKHEPSLNGMAGSTTEGTCLPGAGGTPSTFPSGGTATPQYKPRPSFARCIVPSNYHPTWGRVEGKEDGNVAPEPSPPPKNESIESVDSKAKPPAALDKRGVLQESSQWSTLNFSFRSHTTSASAKAGIITNLRLEEETDNEENLIRGAPVPKTATVLAPNRKQRYLPSIADSAIASPTAAAAPPSRLSHLVQQQLDRMRRLHRMITAATASSQHQHLLRWSNDGRSFHVYIAPYGAPCPLAPLIADHYKKPQQWRSILRRFEIYGGQRYVEITQ